MHRGYQVKASTRSPARVPELTLKNIHAFTIDIQHLTDNLSQFLHSNLLIINITSKDISDFSRLITQIKRSNIRHVLFISSTSVYRSCNTRVAENDSSVLNKTNPLLQIEQLFRDNPHFTTTIIRFSGLVGYNRHPGHFFTENKAVPQADAPVNLIHRDDCISIIQTIIEQSVWGEIFNASADTHPSKRKFYSHARQQLDLPPPQFSTQPTLAYKIISNEKMKHMLNYSLIYPDVMTMPFDRHMS